MIANNKLEEDVFETLKKSIDIDPSKMGVKSIYQIFRICNRENKEENVQLIFDTYDVLLKAVENKLNYYATKLDHYSAKEEAGNVLTAREKSLKKPMKTTLELLVQ